MLSRKAVIFFAFWIGATVLALCSSPSHAGNYWDDWAESLGLTLNEYKGCQLLAVSAAARIDPPGCVKFKNAGWNRCYAASLAQYRIMSGINTDVFPASVKQVGMAACAMLTDNIPERDAFDAAKKTVN